MNNSPSLVDMPGAQGMANEPLADTGRAAGVAGSQSPVRVTANRHDYQVELRAEAFDTLPRKELADDVVAAYIETIRAAQHQDEPSTQRRSQPAVVRDRRAGIGVRVVSSQRLVRGSWSGVDDISLRIAAVNADHRAMLEQEISEVLTLLSREYCLAVHEVGK